MASHLCWQTLTLKLRNPFRLSYGVTDTRQAFWLRLAGDSGWKLLSLIDGGSRSAARPRCWA
jgi:hypothetical protein